MSYKSYELTDKGKNVLRKIEKSNEIPKQLITLIAERNNARKIAAICFRGMLTGFEDIESEILLYDWSIADYKTGYLHFRWCEHCGGEMYYIIPGKCQCKECGK